MLMGSRRRVMGQFTLTPWARERGDGGGRH
jgi:hypothetical protein